MQIGDENVHLVRCVLDEVFGSENFVALITFAEDQRGVAVRARWPIVSTTCSGTRRIAIAIKYRQLFRPKELGEQVPASTRASSCRTAIADRLTAGRASRMPTPAR